MDEDMGVMDLSAPMRRASPPINYSSPSPQNTGNSPRTGVSTGNNLLPVGNSPRTAVSTCNNLLPAGNSRRNLRRAEPRNFNPNNPDQVMSSDDESTLVSPPKTNGYGNGINGTADSESEEDVEMPEMSPIKELSPAELKEREKLVRLLRDELRNEEMALVLLKKLRQSQQMKENIAVAPPTANAQTTGSNLSKTPITSTVNPGTTPQQPPQRSSSLHSSGNTALANNVKANNSANLPTNLQRGGLSSSVRNSSGLHIPTPLGLTVTPTNGRGGAAGMQHPNSNHKNNSSSNRNHYSNERNATHSYNVDSRSSKDSLHISAVSNNQTASPAQPMTKERHRIDDGQTPAQRQAAAKLALRKQLEKTLLQIPPPKPPPPEMHFIPNPSNTEFIYLLGLEHIVDFITKENKTPPPPPEPFKCSQCETSFTPVWKWEKSNVKGRDPKVICEQCVTSNVKKALKAEHTNRLKTAFVKALQQEQEIEQRLAQASPSPVIEPPPPSSTPKPVKRSNPPTPTPQPVPTPPTVRDRAERERDRDSHREVVSHREQRELLREAHSYRNEMAHNSHRDMSHSRDRESHQSHVSHRESHVSHRDPGNHRDSGHRERDLRDSGNSGHRDSHRDSGHRDSGHRATPSSRDARDNHRDSGHRATPSSRENTPTSSSHRESSSSSRHGNLSSLAGQLPNMANLANLPNLASLANLPVDLRDHPLAKLAADGNFSPQHAMALAALNQQLLRGLPQHQQLPAHMLPFSPLLYPYQLAMAQAASGNMSGNSKNSMANNLAELQRQAAEMQRQFLLDMIPNPTQPSGRGHSRNSHMNHNWK